MRPLRIIGKVIGVIIVVALASMLFGYIVMTLWNWLVPGIFHTVGPITFWQAVGLLILAKLLFGGFHGRRHWGRHGRWGGPGYDQNWGGHWGHWKDWRNMSREDREKMKAEWKNGWQDWKQKWHDMTPEDREKMKAQWKERCMNLRTHLNNPDFFTKKDEEKAGSAEPGQA